MTTYLVAVRLLIEANTDPEGEVADVLHGILTENMRKYAGPQSSLIDWAIAAGNFSESIAPVVTSGDYEPNETAFPSWPAERRP
ncbi:hypothetical protein OCA5_pHCG300950 (plasmid) [Afipia carboxidovorans OM5]|uniref:Uncharacterized protein n=1 Tax=Afipia carboxidovorans (strain ATCC 49405 / DSM 1227 / KCTC 32145 / OM5) TaxID=504832 RepID=F8C158_AFIC5|nr:hypothetical protein [Afipia carboxidovorans]AEI04540.1 hypothetical protein OCA4_pHCG3B00950 [Afipia carboxidovorans OM4]AEI08168.1 hypothetical protein OCA5_pHCG300950 [Afipia carboxidovorans OM5]